MESQLQLNTSTGIDLDLPLAGLGRRSFAYVIDWHIRVAVVLLWLLGWLFIEYLLDAQPDGNREDLFWMLLPPSLFYTLYHPVVELLMQGNSPGKQRAGVRCVGLDGQPPTSGSILLRNVMRIIDSLPLFYTVGMVSMLITREQIRLGDMVAGTRMVVAETDSDQALAQLNIAHDASITAHQAELVQELLSRWTTLNRNKRVEFATTLLSQLGITPQHKDLQLRKQLQALISE